MIDKGTKYAAWNARCSMRLGQRSSVCYDAWLRDVTTGAGRILLPDGATVPYKHRATALRRWARLAEPLYRRREMRPTWWPCAVPWRRPA